MNKTKFAIAGLLGLTVFVSGCTSFDEALGRTKTAPDEFQVVVRPPLTLPPNFDLRPGDEDIEETAEPADSIASDAVTLSDQTLTAARKSDGSIYDSVLGTGKRLDGIRAIIDEETLGIQVDRRVPTDIIFGGQPNVGPNLDATREAIRIRRAIEEGRPINEEATPATDPIEGDALEIQ